MRHVRFRRLALATTALALTGGLAAPALAATCVWNGGTGDWGTASAWSCGAIPGSGDVVLIDSNAGLTSTVNLTSNQAASTLSLDSGDTIRLSNAATLSIQDGTLTANGTIAIGGNSYLTTSNANLSLGGTGTITLDTSTGFARLGGNNRLYTIGSGLTVQGGGEIGFDSSFVVNNGRISANVSGQTLYVDSCSGSGGYGGINLGTDTSATFINNNVMEAANGGALHFYSGRYDNTNGTIRALAGSTVFLDGDVALIGGALTTSGSGRITSGAATTYLQNITLTTGSNLLLVAGADTNLSGTFTNNGTVTIASSTNNVRFGSQGGQDITIDGNGTITLDDSGGSHAYLGGANRTLRLGAGQTVQGRGEFGADSTFVVNSGLVTANVAGQTLYVDPYSGSGGYGGIQLTPTADSNAAWVNNGTMQAANGGTLHFYSGRYDNTGGTIRALAGSTVFLDGDVALIGGALTSVGTGQITSTNATTYLQNTTLTNGSKLLLSATGGGVDTNINGSFTNNGTVTIASAANGNVRFGSQGGQDITIDGTGTITLDDSGGNHAYLGGANRTLRLGTGQMVQGRGEFGFDSTFVVNSGLVTANVAGQTLYVDPYSGNGGYGGIQLTPTADANAAWVNNGTMQATNGGTLHFYSGRYDNTGGTIRALAGSTVYLDNDVRIIGGALTSVGSGEFYATNGTTYLQNATLTGGSTLLLSATGGGVLARVNGTLTNNGAITITSAANAPGIPGGDARLGLGEGTAEIAGTGTITLNNSGGNRALLGGENQILRLDAGQTVVGSGEVGFDSTFVVNNGVIDANLAGRTIYVDPYSGSGGYGGIALGTDTSAAFVNNNLMEATNGATLHFYSGRYDNTNGTIEAASGSAVYLDNDVAIIGGALTSIGSGEFFSTNGTTYLQNATLTNGSTLLLSGTGGGVLTRLLGTLTNNGTITVASAAPGTGVAGGDARIGLGFGNATIAGTGTITLDNSRGDRALLGGENQQLTIGAGQTVDGAGEVGFDSTFLINNGNIRATAGTITIDPYSGSGGYGGIGLGGSDTSATVYNTGIIQADNGGNTLQLNSGRYEQAASGSFAAGTGSTFVMQGDAYLSNLETGGILDRGLYQSITGGVASTVNLRGGADSIVQIGTSHAGIDTTVSLFGANSVLEVTPFNGGTPNTIDQTLTSIAQSGQLQIGNGRVFAATNNVGNAGVIALSGGTFTQPSALANSGLVFGNGTVGVAITNTGSVIADGGTMNSQAITGPSGTIRSDAGATLSLAGAGGPSSAGFLTNNGALALGANDITVTSDYQNANFGSGNAFNAHANVTGTGRIFAVSATQDLSGQGLDLTNKTLNVGNVRLGGSSSTTLTITNNGALTTLRGAVQSPATNTVSISSSNFVITPGQSVDVGLSYSSSTAGPLVGNTITVANNFDNVADQMLTIVGAAYNPAAASLSPNPLSLGAARVGGTLSGIVTIGNTAPSGMYSESLAVTDAAGAGGASGTRPTSLIAAGGSAGSTVTLNTATSGTKSGTVTYAFATDGTGTSGLAAAALGNQVETVTGNVYQLAAAQLATNSVTFATVRQGAAAPTATLGVANGANGALNDQLVTSVGALPAGVSATAVPGALNGGQSGSLGFSENTATAGDIGGNGQITFTSHDAQLADVQLAPQTVSFSGKVTQIAIAQILQDAGIGTFTQTGSGYTLDLGTFSGSGAASADLAVKNTIPLTEYAETLGGSASAAAATGYSFAGQTFAGLAGGQQLGGNGLTFTYTGLSDGTYTDLLTFSDFSRFAGLADLQLGPIQVTVTARVSGNVTPPPGAVPEPASWTLMLFGFGSLGAAMRRRRTALRLA